MSTTTPQIRVKPGDHAVHFYPDDHELMGTVGTYLADALAEDAVALVIATRPHLRALEAELRAAGVDVDRALSTESLIPVNAPALLAMLKPRGVINVETFQRQVGGLVRSAGRDRRPVRAYGEMVDLLWQVGDVEGAIELERLWSELLGELRFSLLCAYRSEAPAAPEHESALREVCRLHTAVSPRSMCSSRQPQEDAEASVQFPPEEDAPRAARRFLEETLRRWGPSETAVEDARLVLSELVTNAVIYARSPVSVSIRPAGSKLRIAVHDDSPAEPTPVPDITPDAARGRGLQIVEALSARWGVELTPGGKTVWTEL